MKTNSAEKQIVKSSLSTEELKRLTDFYSLLIQIDKRTRSSNKKQKEKAE